MPYSDDFYARHMAQWANRHAPLCPAMPTPDDVIAAMTRYLDTLDARDRRDAIERGWTYVLNAARHATN